MGSIHIENITKTYRKGEVKALDEISFDVNAGELFGLIGPDGAGKTSLFRILTTLLLPDSGSATVNGFNVLDNIHAIRKCVGYMPGKFSLYQDLTVEENLRFFATLFGTTIAENYHLIKDIYVQIEPFKNRRAGKLSGGMKQKLALCCALIHKPAILFLDEPTTGVDVVSRREFWDMLKNLRQQGITILVSTPYMDEATRCDRTALIQSGKIMTLDTPQNIITQFPFRMHKITGQHMFSLLQDLQKFGNAAYCYAFGDSIHFAFKNENGDSVNHMHQYLQSKGHSEFESQISSPGIEDCFIQLMHP